MVKLKESKLKWALKQVNKTDKELAYVCGIGVRRFQQLKSIYALTGEIPKLNPNRRPRTELSKKDITLIKQVVDESKLSGALSIRLYIQKYYHQTLPRNKIHKQLLIMNVSKPDKKKQKQRKYCRYERKHSFSLGHMDYHVSKAIDNKQLIVWMDDASRYILAGGEFNKATTENAIRIVKQAKYKACNDYRGILLALNTDKGCQFYANTKDKQGNKGISDFEIFLNKESIQHIPSKRNHPQTNGKNERWHRTYEEKRVLFDTFDDFIQWYNDKIHLGLDRAKGITPSEAIITKLKIESKLGIFLTNIDKNETKIL